MQSKSISNTAIRLSLVLCIVGALYIYVWGCIGFVISPTPTILQINGQDISPVPVLSTNLVNITAAGCGVILYYDIDFGNYFYNFAYYCSNTPIYESTSLYTLVPLPNYTSDHYASVDAEVAGVSVPASTQFVINVTLAFTAPLYNQNLKSLSPSPWSFPVSGTCTSGVTPVDISFQTNSGTMTTVQVPVKNGIWSTEISGDLLNTGTNTLMVTDGISNVYTTLNVVVPSTSDGSEPTILNNTSQMGAADAVAIDSSTNIVAVGTNPLGGNTSTLVRYLYTTQTPETAGMLDPNFTISTTPGRMVALTLQPDDSIIIAGDDGAATQHFKTLIYDTTGKLATTVAPSANSMIVGVGRAVALQNDGCIVVVGSNVNNGLLGNFQIVRFAPQSDGSYALDPNFNGTGIVTGPAGIALAVIIDDLGNIVVGGTTASDVASSFFGSGNIQLVRYKSNGDPDIFFQLLPSSGAGSIPGAIIGLALQPNGQIVACGRSSTNGQNEADGLLLRFNSDGSQDTSFNNNSNPTNVSGVYNGVVIQYDGNIVVAGSTSQFLVPPGPGNVLVARYIGSGTNAGLLDQTFNGSGKSMSSDVFAQAVALQADGTIITAGNSTGNAANSYFSINSFNNFNSGLPFGIIAPVAGINYNIIPTFIGTAPSGSYIFSQAINFATGELVNTALTQQSPMAQVWNIVPLASEVQAGTYFVTFQGQYKAGNLNLPAIPGSAFDYLTTTTVTANILSPSATAYSTTALAVYGIAPAGAYVMVSVGPVENEVVQANSEGIWCCSLPGDISNITGFTVTTQPTNYNGDLGAPSNSVALNVNSPVQPDCKRPTRSGDPTAVSILGPSNGENIVFTFPANKGTIDGTCSAPNYLLQLIINGNPTGFFVKSNASGEWSIPLIGSTQLLITATATDPEGNVTRDSVIVTLTGLPTSSPVPEPSPISDLSRAIRSKYCNL